jgi:chemotaxis protein MotB
MGRLDDDDLVPGAKPRPARGFPFRLVLYALIMTAGAAAAGYFAWTYREKNIAQGEKLKTAEARATLYDEQKKKADELEVKVNDETKRNDELMKVSKKMEADLKATESEITNLRELKRKFERRAEAFEALKAKLKDMIESKQVEVARREGRMIIRLPAEVLFPLGSADLSEDGRIALIKLSAALEKMDRKFMVAGHTDTGKMQPGSKYKTNWDLSTARAVTVTQLLITAKIDPKNLVAAGYGEFAPIADNKSESGRKQNRRIEIVLLPNIEELSVFDEEAETKPEPAPEPAPAGSGSAAPAPAPSK